MKPLIYLLFAGLITLSFSACKKCYNCEQECAECKVTDADGEVVQNYDRICGDEDILLSEEECKAMATDNPGSICTCENVASDVKNECVDSGDEEDWLERMASSGYDCVEE